MHVDTYIIHVLVICAQEYYNNNILCFYFTYVAGRDFESNRLDVHFQPGQSSANVCIVIIDDDIVEGSEKFRLLLSIPYSTRSLGVYANYPYYADVIITGMYVYIYTMVNM